jgi:hypothetical protein
MAAGDGQADLNKAATVTLDASGNGTVSLGPDQGPANWHVDGVILQTTRPGVAPIPRAQVWQNSATPQNSQGLTYDGSFSQGPCDISLSRGEQLICTWTGGKAGDVASITVTGKKW